MDIGEGKFWRCCPVRGKVVYNKVFAHGTPTNNYEGNPLRDTGHQDQKSPNG